MYPLFAASLLALAFSGCATVPDTRCVGSYSPDLGRHIDLCRGVVERGTERIIDGRVAR